MSLRQFKQTRIMLFQIAYDVLLTYYLGHKYQQNVKLATILEASLLGSLPTRFTRAWELILQKNKRKCRGPLEAI